MFSQPEKMKRFILETAKQNVPIFFYYNLWVEDFFKTLCKVLIHLCRVPADPHLRSGVQKFGSGFLSP